MSDQLPSNQAEPPEILNLTRLSRGINYIRCKFQNYRARRQREPPTDRAARRTANATYWIAAFTLVAVGVGYKQWTALRGTDEAIRDQLGIMKQQLDAMEVDQRPWIRDNPVVNGAFDVAAEKTIFAVEFQLINIGKSPAKNVRLHSLLGATGMQSAIKQKNAKTLFEEQDFACQFAELSKDRYNPTIFPSDFSSSSWTLNDVGFEKFAVALNPPQLMAVLVGCIAYETTYSAKVHHTRFAYDIGTVAQGGGYGTLEPKPQTIKSSDVRLRRSFFAENTAD